MAGGRPEGIGDRPGARGRSLGPRRPGVEFAVGIRTVDLEVHRAIPRADALAPRRLSDEISRSASARGDHPGVPAELRPNVVRDPRIDVRWGGIGLRNELDRQRLMVGHRLGTQRRRLHLEMVGGKVCRGWHRRHGDVAEEHVQANRLAGR